jgi:GGDEF domain-containing protein
MKPSVFIASSSEALPLALAIQANLNHQALSKVWNQGVFELTNDTLEDLLRELKRHDFGIFVLAPDDVVRIRSESHPSARDNVLFESGLFLGRHGRRRSFLIRPSGHKFRIPSDLLGINMGEYDSAAIDDDNEQAVLGPACVQISRAITKYGAVDDRIRIAVTIERVPAHSLKLKVMVTIRNDGPDVLIKGLYSKVLRPLRHDPNALIVNSGKGHIALKMRDVGDSTHIRSTIFLRSRKRTDTFIPLDPAQTDEEVHQALITHSVGKLYFNCFWPEDEEASRRWVVEM